MKTFLPVAPESHFSIHNLPYGIFSRENEDRRRVGVAIGEMILDLAALEERGFFDALTLSMKNIFTRPSLNAFMAQGRPAWQKVRATVQSLLMSDNPVLRDDDQLRRQALVPMSQASLHLPAAIGDYTDFYSSREHATNVGSMFRGKEKALQPNWLHLPVAYHGRASSVIVSGTDIRRPYGQVLPLEAGKPIFTPSQEMDFELEMGFFVGPGNDLGRPITIEEASEHIFGLVLVNDWSARDIQRWEYRPLGPFLSKNLATSISPWVVPLEALLPFRCPGPVQDPAPLTYLRTSGDSAFDIHLEVHLQGREMEKPAIISSSNARYLYWNMAQQLAHHSVTGCNMRPGDLLASGTISGPKPDSYGSLLELAWRGTRPIRLPNGERRAFLEDGDRITLTGWCQGDGYRVGFGTVSACILPAVG